MKKFKITTILLCIIILLFIAVYKVELKLDNIRKKNKYIESSIVNDSASPLLAFTTVALGGFRGIIADFLWLRTISLQSQGKYFEMVQLASLINKLQPGFTGTTTFLAWNMAYNISVTFANPRDKWRWVQNAIDLLKNAIKDTPNKQDLYNELAWIYINKIGESYDSANLYYKHQLAAKMYEITKYSASNWEAIAEAPRNWLTLKNLLQKNNPSKNLLNNMNFSKEKLLTSFNKNKSLPPKLSETIGKKNADIILCFLQKRLLIHKFMLTPMKILEINKTFGNLDWNLWQAHGIYWIYTSPGSIKNNKMILSFLLISLNSILNNGTLLNFDSDNYRTFTTGPNLDIIEPTQKYLYQLSKQSRYTKFIENNYKKFINNAILLLYIFRDNKIAVKYYIKSGIKFPDDTTYKVNFKDFIDKQIATHFPVFNRNSALSQIKKCLKFHFIYFDRNQLKPSMGYFNLARILYNAYNLKAADKLPPFSELSDMLKTETSTKEKYYVSSRQN